MGNIELNILRLRKLIVVLTGSINECRRFEDINDRRILIVSFYRLYWMYLSLFLNFVRDTCINHISKIY